jgi:glutamate decarboxylase
MSNLTRTADYLTEILEGMGFIIMSERAGQGLPLVAFRFASAEEGGKDDRHYDEFALAHSLRSRGWVVPAYTMAPHTEGLKMLRVVVREDFSRSRCDLLIADIKLCLGLLEETDRDSVKRQEEYIKTHIISSHKAKQSHGDHDAPKAYKVLLLYSTQLWDAPSGSHILLTFPLFYRTRSTLCKASMGKPTPSAKLTVARGV